MKDRTLVRSRLKWAGRVERIEGERLTKRADALSVEGRRSRRRPETVRGELCEERFGGTGRGVEDGNEGWGSGDGGWRQQ